MPCAAEVHLLEDRIAVDRVRMAGMDAQSLRVAGFDYGVAFDVAEPGAVILEVPEIKPPAGDSRIAKYGRKAIDLCQLLR